MLSNGVNLKSTSVDTPSAILSTEYISRQATSNVIYRLHNQSINQAVFEQPTNQDQPILVISSTPSVDEPDPPSYLERTRADQPGVHISSDHTRQAKCQISYRLHTSVDKPGSIEPIRILRVLMLHVHHQGTNQAPYCIWREESTSQVLAYLQTTSADKLIAILSTYYASP